MPKHTPSQPAPKPEPDDIEFSSPGVYSIHNPVAPHQTTDTPELEQDESLGTVGQPKRVLLRTPASINMHYSQLLSQARREVCIYSYELDPALYDNDETYAQCKNFLLAHERNRLRILIRDSTLIAQHGHRLIALSERLHSRCQIKRVNSEHDFSDNYWMAIDNQALLLRQCETDKQASVYYYDPVLALKKQQEFNAMWSVAQSDVNLRRMPL